MTQGSIEISPPLRDNVVLEITKGLGISMDDLNKDCPVCIASTGHSKVMVGINSNSLLHGLKPDSGMLKKISEEIHCNGYYVFTLNPGEDILVHGRMFAPAIGIPEGPVTGNANGPLGAYLVHYDLMQEDTQDIFSFSAMQGEAIGRTGTMKVTVKKKGTVPSMVQITGDAVIAFSTTLTL